MKALKLDAHFFVKDYRRPERKDIGGLVELFDDLELMPQIFDEHNAITQENLKRLSFTNPEKNQTIFFQTEKILFSQGFNPFDGREQNWEEIIEPFFKFLSTALPACNSFTGGSLKASRLSVVGDFMEPIDDSLEPPLLIKNIANAVPWCENPLREIKMRTAEAEHLDDFDEPINVVIAVNDGMIEQSGAEGHRRKKCYLVQLDVNTMLENINPRFDIDLSQRVWRDLASVIEKRLDKIGGFLVSEG